MLKSSRNYKIVEIENGGIEKFSNFYNITEIELDTRKFTKDNCRMSTIKRINLLYDNKILIRTFEIY